MRLPAQVQRQIQRSEQLIEDYKKSQADNAPPAADAANVAAPAQGEQVDTSTQPTNNAPPAPDATGEPKPREDYKAKYFTLQGMFNVQRDDLRAAKARIEELEAKSVATGSANPPPGTATLETPTVKKLPEAIREALGAEAADQLETVLSTNDANTRKEIEGAKTTAAKAEKDTREAAHVTKTHEFLNSLASACPDWQAIDKREDWQAFLALRDPIARKPRQQLLQEAYADYDHDAVAALFDAFKKLAGISAAATPEPRKQALERQVTPSNAGAAPSRTPEARMWTRAQITQAYKDQAIRPMPADKFALIEADIIAAQSEGRVR